MTYSTRLRGGVVHTLQLAEALTRLGCDVTVIGLGDPEEGFARPVSASYKIIPAPPRAATLEERVFAAIDALADGLPDALGDRYPLVHVQDCISARAAVRLRDAGAAIEVLRTVHHVDDFTTEALVECQRRSIFDPDHLVVVSRHWRERLASEFGVDATVVTNGVDAARFAGSPTVKARELRARVGAEERMLFLTVGGIEPRKGSRQLVEATALVRATLDPPPVVAVVGGHSFQDHTAYRQQVLERADQLALDGELKLVGTVPDEELPSWYHAADAFLFPSVKEGFGLVVLEALAAGLPVVTTDIPVFREYLTEGEGVLLVRAGDSRALAGGMLRLATDAQLRSALAAQGPEIAARFSWETCAQQHVDLYRGLYQR
ncbi:MAG: MSMEG_0565 family glycosyltransferase [Egibacteraceae bacterium]